MRALAKSNRESAADKGNNPYHCGNGGLGGEQPLRSCVPQQTEGLQQLRLQVAIGGTRRFETDRCPVQFLQVDPTPIDDLAFGLRGPLDPHHRLKIAYDLVANRGHLRVGKADGDTTSARSDEAVFRALLERSCST